MGAVVLPFFKLKKKVFCDRLRGIDDGRGNVFLFIRFGHFERLALVGCYRSSHLLVIN